MNPERSHSEKSNVFQTILKSKILLQNAIDGIDDCIVIVDQDFRILWANLSTIIQFSNIRAEDITAKSFQKAIGKHCYQFLFNTMDPLFRNRAQCPLKSLFSKAEPATATIRFKDKIFEMVTFPLQSTGSSQRVAILILRDMTEMIRTQESMQQLIAIQNILIQKLPMGLIVTDASLRITMANNEIGRLFHIDPNQCRGLPLQSLMRFPDSVRKDLTDNLKQYCKTGQPISNLQLSSVPILDGEGIIQIQTSRMHEAGTESSLILLIKDLTDEMVLKEHITFNLLSNEVGQITKRVSRELRNPLGVIRGFAEHILQSGCPEEIKSDIEEIYAQSLRTHSIITNLLDFAQPDSIGYREIDLNAVIERVAKYQEFEALSAKVQLVTELDGNLPTKYTSDAAMRQVLLNLVQNGIQATDPGGQIIVRSQYLQEDNTIEISVVDTGRGIPAATQQTVFNPFFSTKKNGSGLGLSIVKAIVEQNNGTIELMSSVGIGSVFKIRFPLAKELPASGPEKEKQ